MAPLVKTGMGTAGAPVVSEPATAVYELGPATEACA